MLDLTSELSAAQTDGTMPSSLNTDTLWVTSSDRIIVPESAGELDNGSRDADAALACIASFVDRMRSSTAAGTPLPRYATHAMVAARSAKSVDEVHALFRATVGRPVNISRMRRGGLLTATLAVVFFIPIVAMWPIRTVERTDSDGRKLSS